MGTPSVISVSSGLSAGVFTNGANAAFGRTLNSLTGNDYSAKNRLKILNPAAFTFVGYVIGALSDAPKELRAKERERAKAPPQQSP
jgi:hypothetical protein